MRKYNKVLLSFVFFVYIKVKWKWLRWVNYYFRFFYNLLSDYSIRLVFVFNLDFVDSYG